MVMNSCIIAKSIPNWNVEILLPILVHKEIYTLSHYMANSGAKKTNHFI